MQSALKVTLAYLFIATVWILGSNWLLSVTFPALYPAIGVCNAWCLLLVTCAMLYAFLVKELGRRDAIERHLRALAVYDPLTGLLNRACFVENLEKAVARAAREGRKVGVAFIDLDGFKAVNDQYGHQAGDQLLVEVGQRISTVVRAADSAGRFGGDEFVVLIQARPRERHAPVGRSIGRRAARTFLHHGFRCRRHGQCRFGPLSGKRSAKRPDPARGRYGHVPRQSIGEGRRHAGAQNPDLGVPVAA